MNQEIFIPIKISTCKGRRAVAQKPNGKVSTPFSRLLVKSYWLKNQLRKYPYITFKEFCELHKISPRYARAILSMDNLSPKIQQLIMNGYCPSHLSVHDITNKKFTTIWKEQEAVFVK
jgi:hypothetical protein